MPRLKNANHEKFAKNYAKELLKDGDNIVNTHVYQKTYPKASYDSARSTVPVILATPSVQARITEIIQAKNPPEAISQDLANLRKAKKEILDSEGNIIKLIDNPTRVAAVALVMKATGAFSDEARIDSRSINYFAPAGSESKMESILDRMDKLTQKLGTA